MKKYLNTYGYDHKKISRYYENLDRGVVAIRSGWTTAYISWRFLITDDDNIAFNVYRQDESNHTLKVNNQSISTITHFYDNTYDASKSYNYFVGSIVKGVEVENSSYYFIAANTPILDGFRVQIRPGASSEQSMLEI